MGSWLIFLLKYGLVLNERSFLLNKSRVEGPLHPFHVSMMDFPTKARTYTKWFMPKIANFTIDHQSLSGIDDIIFTVTWHEVDESTLTLIYLVKKKIKLYGKTLVMWDLGKMKVNSILVPKNKSNTNFYTNGLFGLRERMRVE